MCYSWPQCLVSLSSIPVQRQLKEAEEPRHPQLLLLLLPRLQCGGAAQQQLQCASAPGRGERWASEGQCGRELRTQQSLWGCISVPPFVDILNKGLWWLRAQPLTERSELTKKVSFFVRISQSFPFSNWSTCLMTVIRITSHFYNILSWVDGCMKWKAEEPVAEKDMEDKQRNRGIPKTDNKYKGI